MAGDDHRLVAAVEKIAALLEEFYRPQIEMKKQFLARQAAPSKPAPSPATTTPKPEKRKAG